MDSHQFTRRELRKSPTIFERLLHQRGIKPLAKERPRAPVKPPPPPLVVLPRHEPASRAKIHKLIAKDAQFRAVEAARRQAHEERMRLRTAERLAQDLGAKAAGVDAFDTTPAQVFVTQPEKRGRRKTARQRRRERKKRNGLLPRAQRARGQRERHEEYEAYINSVEWQRFRLGIFKARGRQCEQCGTLAGIMHVHHLHYRNFMHEKPEDVKVLCEPCHRAVHANWAKSAKTPVRNPPYPAGTKVHTLSR